MVKVKVPPNSVISSVGFDMIFGKLGIVTSSLLLTIAQLAVIVVGHHFSRALGRAPAVDT